MNEQPNHRLSQVHAVITRIAGIAVLATGLLALVCWRFDWAAPLRAVPGLQNIKANSALGFIFAAAGLWLCRRPQRPGTVRWAGRACALMVIGIGAVSLCNLIFGWFAGYDEWLLHGLDSVPLPGKISYLTALNFFLIGLGLLLMDCGPKRKSLTGQFFTLSVILVCLLAVIGHFTHLGVFYGETTVLPGTHLGRMLTACFLVLGAGILCARPEGGLMRVLMSRTDGGFI